MIGIRDEQQKEKENDNLISRLSWVWLCVRSN